jgi:phosphatidylglycerophosphate synthase
MVGAILGGVALAAAFNTGGDQANTMGRALLVFAAACFQFRLICNLIDGMVAVEGGLGTPAGELYNDVPDRVADAAALIGAGYAACSIPELGYIAAIVAIMTAYIRAVGKGAGAGADFSGIMDKKKRMLLLTAAAIVLAAAPRSIEPFTAIAGRPVGVWPITLALITLGSLITCITRLRNINRKLNASS